VKVKILGNNEWLLFLLFYFNAANTFIRSDQVQQRGTQVH